MVAEPRYGLRAGFQYLQVQASHPQAAMSLRGTHMAGEVLGDAIVRAASVGFGVAAVGEAATKVVDAVGASCSRRSSRGRKQVDINGKPVTPPSHLSIVSNLSSDTPAGAQGSGHQTEPEDWKIDKERMQNIIQQQSDDANQMLLKLEEVQKQMDKVTSENLDVRKYFDTEVEQIVNTVEHGYHKQLLSKTAEINEQKDAEIRLLQMQLAKTRPTDKEDQEERDRVRKEIDFQKEMYKQSPEDAMRAEKRTMAACGSGCCCSRLWFCLVSAYTSFGSLTHTAY